MAEEKVSVTSPVGRIVNGSLYKPNEKDLDGNPLLYKTGINKGKPRVQYFFAIAIPKNAGETHWSSTEWGAKIWAVGHKEFPQAAQRPDFSWKVEDGDSTIPNKRNKRPCDQEGWKGCWLLKFSSSFAPVIYRQQGNGWVQMMEPDAVKTGYYVQVAFTLDGNGNQINPGVYVNPSLVCFRANGPEIVFGPSVEDAGFGLAPLPAGVSEIPAAVNNMPAVPTYPVASPPIPITPNPTFLQVPMPSYGASATVPGVVNAGFVAPVVPQPVPPPVVPVVTTTSPSNRNMTAKAGAVSYEAFIAGGWSDAQLIAQGYMTL